VFTEYDLLELFLSWIPNPQRISVLLPTLILDALHILKEHRMPNDYPILHFVVPSEDKNVVYLSLSTREDMPIPVKECTHAPSQSGTCQSSLLARDSHQQLLLMGPLFA